MALPPKVADVHSQDKWKEMIYRRTGATFSQLGFGSDPESKEIDLPVKPVCASFALGSASSRLRPINILSSLMMRIGHRW